MNVENLSDFDKLKTIRINIKKTIEKIKQRSKELQKSYLQYINKESEDDFFGLDSLQFQIKLMNLEFDNTYTVYTFIENRIYGDYYKLLTLIRTYLNTNLPDRQIKKIKELSNFEKYPVYKDLDKFKRYDFNVINEIHHDIIIIISGMSEIVRDNEHDIMLNEQKLATGIKIDNYINSYRFKNESLRVSMSYYNNILQVYHRYHFDVLEKFLAKIMLSSAQLSETLSEEEVFAQSKREKERSQL
jgi:hypothetical protein